MLFLKKYNLALLILPILLFSLGYLTLLSTSPDRAKDQLLFFIVGYLVYLGISLIDFQVWKVYWKYIYLFSIFLLLITFILGEVRFGSSRWIDLGFFSIQPSEFAKISLIIALSSVISSSTNSLKKIKTLLSFVLLTLPVAVLVFIQPDLGTTIVLMAVLAAVLFFAGLDKWYFIISFLAVGIFSSPLWGLLKDYQKKRILVFLNPSLDVLGSGYNVIQAQIAVGSGGIFGKGFGHGTQSQLNFLPAHWTDFAFASFAEEWGFIGVSLLIALFALLLIVLLISYKKTKDSGGSLIVGGVFTVFLVQFLINVGMNLGVMPVTGIPLPFISYGGSSILVSLLLLGLVQSVLIYSHAEPYSFPE